MKAIIPILDEHSKRPYYLQLYDTIKKSILSGEMTSGEKLPSLRRLSKNLGLSLTTIELAYSQLSVEGYIYSKPQSGFFVSDISHVPLPEGQGQLGGELDFANVSTDTPAFRYQFDLSCFDFNKWKKCLNKILTEYPHLLLSEGDPRGEAALRYEISKYLYRSRGVTCQPDQIVIGAGTQQLTGQLSLILSRMAIGHVAVEHPGYLPVQSIFRDRGFTLIPIPVKKDGICLEALPNQQRTAVYISPSNQFPTGAVMPVGKRYALLEWAFRTDSIIIEDDYDSELRYFGKPIPALQGLDTNQRVIYLGSFSSTLFPSIRISYMVLPHEMTRAFGQLQKEYTQTCSKTEQLTLALFMEHGFYQTNIRKLRTLYAQKLQAILHALQKYGRDFIRPVNPSSGINLILGVKTNADAADLCRGALEYGAHVVPVSHYAEEKSKEEQGTCTLILYYNQIPLDRIEETIQKIVCCWKASGCSACAE